MRSQEAIPGWHSSPLELMARLHRCSAECLISSNYSTSPGPHTIEALLLSLQNEFIRRRDAHLGVWVMAGVALRLAMRMGYHRDPVSYPELSVFEGEMRRRIWALMVQLDGLTSYQLGLPPLVQEALCDTKLPRNLLDEDLGVSTTILPPSRPESELTPVSYILAKSRLSAVFRRIYIRVCLGRTAAYEEIMDLQRQLLEARNAISIRFRLSSPLSSVTVSPFLLVRRYSLELLFQKSVCILHRHHMT